jgi:glutaredoxin-related protein
MKDLSLEDSKKMAKLLKDNGVKFLVSEVKGDKALEEFMLMKYKEKVLPLCFIGGEFIGNFEALNEICQKRNLLKLVSQNEWSLNSKQKFDFLINSFQVVCFIEGNYEDKEKKENQRVFEILRKNNLEFEYFNVLFDLEVKEIVKEFSGLKSFPIVIHNKKIIGGVELLEEIEKEGEIGNLFK